MQFNLCVPRMMRTALTSAFESLRRNRHFELYGKREYYLEVNFYSNKIPDSHTGEN